MEEVIKETGMVGDHLVREKMSMGGVKEVRRMAKEIKSMMREIKMSEARGIVRKMTQRAKRGAWARRSTVRFLKKFRGSVQRLYENKENCVPGMKKSLAVTPRAWLEAWS